MTDTLSLVEFETILGDEYMHLECCREERFFCGAPYHPELSASRLQAPFDEVCLVCLEVMEQFRCHLGHQHCPIVKPWGWICPDPGPDDS